MSKASYIALAACVAAPISLTAAPEVAYGQSTPSPSPAPSPSPGPSRGDPSLIQKRNSDFSQEFELRQLMSTPESYSKAYGIADMVSRCAVEKMGDDASTLVGGAMTDDEKFEALSGALRKNLRQCFRDDAAGLPMMIVNASLAEAILKSHNEQLEPRAMSLNQDDIDAFTTMGPGTKINFDIIGRCSAVFSPGLTYDVLETRPGSAEELSALNNLYKNTPECGLREAPDGAPATYQRSVLATGLFHWLARG